MISSSLLNASESCARNKKNKSDITGIDAIGNPFKTPFLDKTKTKQQNVARPKLIHLFDLKELDVEDQLRVARDAGKSLLAVGEMGRDRDATLSTDSHASNTDVPALDDFALTELEAERFTLLVGCTRHVSIK